MKKLILCLCILCSAIPAFSQIYYKYQIVDAAEANKIYNATGGPGWNRKDNWPVKEGATIGYQIPDGISFAFADTVLYPYPPPAIDTGVVRLMIKILNLTSYNLSGALPAFAMDSLKEAHFSDNHLTGIGNIEAPALKVLNVNFNLIAELPVFNLPSLEYFNAWNAGIQGALVQWNTPALQFLNLPYNNITSVTSGLAYSQLKVLNLVGNKVEGTLSQWGTPKLEYLNLGENNLSGVSSTLAYPNLYYFDLAGNEITGDLPNWNFPNLKDLLVQTNHFTGNIPQYAYPLMENFQANSNNLTGEIPDFNWPNLKVFDVRNNQLSGDLPNLNAPLLENYLLADNKLKGDLKNLNFPVLQYLWLGGNQLDGIIKSPIDLPELIRFDLSGNKLKGQLANFNLPKVELFFIAHNDFSGEFPNADMPKLSYLKIEENNFTRLPDFTSSAYLYHVSCRYNRLHFEDLLPYQGLTEFIYNQMQPVDMYASPIGDSIQLSVNVRGVGNEYTWYKGAGNIVKMDTNDLMIYKTENPEDYDCWITNPMLPNLTLHSKLAQPVLPPCWTNGIFDICITGSNEGWEKGDEENEIQTELPISINDFILFEGLFSIDTVDLVAKIYGKFFIENIPLPGGNVGNFTLADGEYTLALAGSDGIITGFINDALQYVPEIGGLKIKLENLQLVGGLNATGVSLAFNVSFDNITPSCGNTTGQTTEISIEGLKITSDGISVDGLEVGDLGIAPGFCLKELVAKYDEDNDKLTFGISILTPFIEVGGGLGFIGGEVDSISMKAEFQNSIIPLAATGIGIIGCEGRINSITSPPWNMRFGGIFSAVLNDDLFRLTTSVEYIPPSELKIEAGDGKFFNPPFYDDWWLIEGGIYGSIDLKSYKMKVGGQIKLAPFLDGNEKKFMGSGSIDMSYTSAHSSFFGKFDGMITLPKLPNYRLFDWLGSKVGLPYTTSGNAILIYKPGTEYILGNVNFGGRIGDLQFRIELAKPYSDPDHFTLTVVDGQVTPVHAATFDYTFIVPDQTTMAVVKATHTTDLPAVSLRQPDGTEISEAIPSADAELDKDAEAHKTFWTLYTPQAGLWTAAVDAAGADIEVYYFGQASVFTIAATQEADGLHVTWDPSLFASTDSIDFFADDDRENFDGAYMMTVSATLGAAIIPNALFENQCAFNLQVLAYQDQSLLTDYAEASFTNSLSTFGLPEDIAVTFNAQTLLIEMSWTPSAHPNIAGYVIELVDNGVSRVIGMPYSDESTFTYQLDAYTGQRLVIYAYGTEGEVSCASKEYELTTTAVEALPEPVFTENLFVYPNPFTDICTIRINSTEDKVGILRVFTNQGVLLRTLPQISLLKGVNEVSLSLSDMPPGNYFITCHSANTVLTSQVILVK